MQEIEIKTGQREEILDISNKIEEKIKINNWDDGILMVFCPHTSASLTINEFADPDVRLDIRKHMKDLVPRNNNFAHREGNSDAHIKTSLFGPHIFLIVDKGKLALGRWQGAFFCEWDGPRSRKVWLKFIKT